MTQTVVTLHATLTELTAFLEYLDNRLSDGDLHSLQNNSAKLFLQRLHRAQKQPGEFPNMQHLRAGLQCVIGLRESDAEALSAWSAETERVDSAGQPNGTSAWGSQFSAAMSVAHRVRKALTDLNLNLKNSRVFAVAKPSTKEDQP